MNYIQKLIQRDLGPFDMGKRNGRSGRKREERSRE
jgi:hypothetical protein